MTDRTDEFAGVVEPVHWGSRLVRAPDIHYTEVAGVPCLVRDSDGDVQALTPTWAALWAQLDGRPITEALSVDPGELEPVDARNLIEVLRRLKGMRVIGDVTPEFTEGVDDLQTTSAPGRSVKITFHGFAERNHGVWRLTVDPASGQSVTVELTDETSTVGVTIRRRFRRRTVETVVVDDEAATSTAPVALGSFASIVRAVQDQSVLSSPGLVDLLAGLAERAGEPVSLRR